MCVTLRHEDRVDPVVDASRRAQSENVPVVDQRCLLDRQHEDAGLARALDHAEGVDVRPMLDAGRKTPRPTQEKAVPLGHGGSRPRALTRNDRETRLSRTTRPPPRRSDTPHRCQRPVLRPSGPTRRTGRRRSGSQSPEAMTPDRVRRRRAQTSVPTCRRVPHDEARPRRDRPVAPLCRQTPHADRRPARPLARARSDRRSSHCSLVS